MSKLILILLMVSVLLVSGCIQGGQPDTKISPTSQPTNTKIDSGANPKILDLTSIYGCVEDDDCVIGRGVCGTSVYNKNWNWEKVPEHLKEWAKDEMDKINGIVCAAGRYASNPRCENSECIGDYITG